MNIRDEIKESTEIINNHLYDSLRLRYTIFSEIEDIIRYAVFPGGKRLRPILALKSYEMYSQDIGKILPYASAIELIHSYSLVHDDLPCMDNDDFRRGKESCHKKYGEANGLLIGDALLNKAFELLSSIPENRFKDYESYRRHFKAMKYISHNSGIYGMIGGQYVDLKQDFESTNDEVLYFIYKTKTAALIKSACVVGAIIAGENDENIELLELFGEEFGLAFQIKDDIDDYDKDMSIKRPTFATLGGLSKAKELVNHHSKRAKNYLDKIEGLDTRFFRELTDYIF